MESDIRRMLKFTRSLIAHILCNIGKVLINKIRSTCSKGNKVIVKDPIQFQSLVHLSSCLCGRGGGNSLSQKKYKSPLIRRRAFIIIYDAMKVNNVLTDVGKAFFILPAAEPGH